MVQTPEILIEADFLKVVLPVNDLASARQVASQLTTTFPYIASLASSGNVQHERGTEYNKVGASFVQSSLLGRKLRYRLEERTTECLKFSVFDEKKAETFDLLVEFVQEQGETAESVVVTSRPLRPSKTLFDVLSCCCMCYRHQIFNSLVSRKEESIRKRALKLQQFLMRSEPLQQSVISPTLEPLKPNARVEMTDEALEVMIPVDDIAQARDTSNNLLTFLTLLLPAINDGSVVHVQGTPDTDVGAMFSHRHGKVSERYSVIEMTKEKVVLQMLDDKKGPQMTVHFVEEDVGTGTVVIITRKLEFDQITRTFFDLCGACLPPSVNDTLVAKRLKQVEDSLGALHFFLNNSHGGVQQANRTLDIPTFSLPDLGTVGPMTVESLNSTITKEDEQRFSEIRSVLTGSVNDSPYTVTAVSLLDVNEAFPKKIGYESVLRITKKIADSLEVEDEAQDSDNEEANANGSSKLTKTFEQLIKPNINLNRYITRLVDGITIWYEEDTAEIGLKTVIYANELLRQMVISNQVSVNAFNVHRLFAILTLLSAKIVNDKVLSNSGWAAISGIDVEEVTKLEDILCFELDFNFRLAEGNLTKLFRSYDLMFKNDERLEEEFVL